MSGSTWLLRKWRAAQCKWEVVEDHGPNYCPVFVSKHITKEKAELIAENLEKATGKKYKVIHV